MAEQPHACGRSAPKAKGTEMACRYLKSSPAQHPLGNGLELATGLSTAKAEDMQINPTSSPLFWLQQLQTNFLQRGKKKKKNFPGLHISVSVKLQSSSWGGKRAVERTSKVLWHPCWSLSSFSKLFLPSAETSSLPQVGSAPGSKYSAPQGHRADSPGYSISQHVEEMASMGQAGGMELLSPWRGCPANAPCPCSGGDNSSCSYGRFGSRFEAWKEAATSDRTSWMPFSKGSWHNWISHAWVPGHALKMELEVRSEAPKCIYSLPFLFFFFKENK